VGTGTSQSLSWNVAVSLGMDNSASAEESTPRQSPTVVNTVVLVSSRSRFRLGVAPTALNDRHITRENRARRHASLPRVRRLTIEDSERGATRAHALTPSTYRIGSWQEDEDDTVRRTSESISPLEPPRSFFFTELIFAILQLRVRWSTRPLA
jgi:hypothetical protein